MIDDYNQTGMFPKWSANNGETYVMVGDPSDPIIADAYAFGVRGFDANQALSDMVTEAQTTNNIRPGLNYYLNARLPADRRVLRLLQLLRRRLDPGGVRRRRQLDLPARLGAG